MNHVLHKYERCMDTFFHADFSQYIVIHMVCNTGGIWWGEVAEEARPSSGTMFHLWRFWDTSPTSPPRIPMVVVTSQLPLVRGACRWSREKNALVVDDSPWKEPAPIHPSPSQPSTLYPVGALRLWIKIGKMYVQTFRFHPPLRKGSPAGG